MAAPESPLRVFISYTAEDLVDHADAVRDAVRRLQWVAVDHRDWPANGRPSVGECKERVASCEILVVLVAHRYGWVPSRDEGGDGERSITWLEVEEARANGLGRFDGKRLDGADHVERDVELAEAFTLARGFDPPLRGLAVIGDPGSGKTTAARYLTWRCADAVQGPESLGLDPRTLPVYLPLRRLRTADLDGGLAAFLKRELASIHLSGSADLGETLLRRGRLLWILDGLDEVADPAVRARVSAWIEDALDARADDHFLVTSRYAGYRGDAVLNASFV